MAGGRGHKPVCKFYLEGRCKFGRDCRFYHPANNTGYGDRGGGSYVNDRSRSGQGGYGGKTTPRPNDFGGGFRQKYTSGNQFQLFSDNGNQRERDHSHRQDSFTRHDPWNNSYDRGRSARYDQQACDPPTTPKDIAANIRTDMEEWMNSGMWPLSCYSYAKEGRCMPELNDVSPDEIRWEAYQAKTSGNSAHYLHKLNELGEQQMRLRRQFSQITADDVQSLQSNPSTLSTDSHTLFGSADGSKPGGLFGLPQAPMFDTKPQVSAPQSTKSTLFLPSSSGWRPQPVFSSGPSSSPPGALGGTASPSALTLNSLLSGSSAQPAAQTSNPGHRTLREILNHAQIRELTKVEVDAFHADKFVLGEIPEHAPPQTV